MPISESTLLETSLGSDFILQISHQFFSGMFQKVIQEPLLGLNNKYIHDLQISTEPYMETGVMSVRKCYIAILPANDFATDLTIGL